MSYLLTGTGRCGTGYVAALLTEAGYKCGHERMFGLESEGHWLRGWHESSWLGVRCQMDRRIHVTRNVVDVARSLARTRVMADLDHGYGAAHARLCPDLRSVSCPLVRGWMWIGWVYGVLEDVPRWDVSEDPGKLAELMGLDAERVRDAARRVSKDVNTRPRTLPSWWVEPHP